MAIPLWIPVLLCLLCFFVAIVLLFRFAAKKHLPQKGTKNTKAHTCPKSASFPAGRTTGVPTGAFRCSSICRFQKRPNGRFMVRPFVGLLCADSPYRSHNSLSGTARIRLSASGRQSRARRRAARPDSKSSPQRSASRTSPLPSPETDPSGGFDFNAPCLLAPGNDHIDLHPVLVAIVPETQIRFRPGGLGNELLYHKGTPIDVPIRSPPAQPVVRGQVGEGCGQSGIEGDGPWVL